jgi:four helix bundle protein
MTNLFKFENLECWQKAKDLAVEIYKMSMHGKLERDYCLRDQMRKSVVSIISNIAEGKERETSKELIRYLFIARGSAGELKAQLIIAKEIGYLNNEQFQDLIEKTEIISAMIGSLIKSIRMKR